MRRTSLPSSSISHYLQGICFSLLALLGLLSGCSATETVEERITHSIPAFDSPVVYVKTFNGNISIKTHTQEDVRVHITKIGAGETRSEAQADLSSVEVSVSQDSDKIEIIARHLHDRTADGSAANIQLTIPVGSNLNVLNGTGDISFQGALADGDHAFQAGHGSIMLMLSQEAIFNINALTGNGKIISDFLVSPTVEGTDNILNGSTGTGAAVWITATTSSGDITLRKIDEVD